MVTRRSDTHEGWGRALVTGASSGIGAEFARALAARGTDLVVVARSEDRLASLQAELSSVDVEVLVADLGSPGDVAQVADRLRDVDRPIDLLVNNAGFGKGGPIVDNDMAVARQVIAVNVTALMTLSHAAAVAMAAAGVGAIVNVSSVAGELIAPDSAVYSASKAFVTSFSESLHQELRSSGVVVTVVLPGFTRTEFQERADVATDDIPSWAWQSPKDVADEGLRAAAAGKPRIVTGSLNKAATGIAAASPTSLLRLAGRGVRKRRTD